MIYGERIRLRRDERSDIPKFVEWLNDPEVRRYLLLNMPISQAQRSNGSKTCSSCRPMNSLSGSKYGRSSAEGGGDDWRLIGNCSFMDINWTARSAEVGLFIGDKSCWNKGYGTEVMRFCCGSVSKP